jgi:predicted Zn-dependent protease
MRDAAPDSVELNFLTGASWVNLEQPEKGMPYLNQALRANPAFLPAHAALGQGLLRMGRAKDALPHLQRALPIDEDGTIHFQLFRAYQLAGDSSAAQQALAQYREFTSRLAPEKQHNPDR